MPLPASLEAPVVHTRPGFECTALLQCGEDPRVPDRSIPLPYCVLDGERWIDPSHFAAAFGYSEVPLRTARHQPRLTAPLQPSRAFAVLQADYPRHFKWIRLENPGITRHCVTLRIILLFFTSLRSMMVLSSDLRTTTTGKRPNPRSLIRPS